MRFVQRTLGRIFVATTMIVVAVVEGSASDTGWGWLGALAGLLITLAGLQLGMLAGAAVFGARVHRVVIGFGRLWREWRTPRRSIVLRGFPVLLSLSIGPGSRAPVRPRLWLCGLCSALLGLAVVTVLWLNAGGSFGRGATIGATATMLHALIPQRNATMAEIKQNRICAFSDLM